LSLPVRPDFKFQEVLRPLYQPAASTEICASVWRIKTILSQRLASCILTLFLLKFIGPCLRRSDRGIGLETGRPVKSRPPKARMTSFILYIDPGSGSYLVQMIIAAVLAGLFYLKNIWSKIRNFFRNKKNDGQS